MWLATKFLIAVGLVLTFSALLACLTVALFRPEVIRVWWRVRQQQKAEQRQATLDREYNPLPMAYRHLWPDQVTASERMKAHARVDSLRVMGRPRATASTDLR